MAKPGARQHHGGQVRVGDVDGDAAGNQCGVTRLQGELGLQRGAQIEPGAVFGGVGRQRPFVAETRVEQLDLQGLEGGIDGHACNLWAIRDNSCSASTALEVPGNTCSPPCQ